MAGAAILGAEPYWRAGAPERRLRTVHVLFGADRRRLRVGLVNLMPDAALLAAERQFRQLFERALPERTIEFVLFHIPEQPRGLEAKARLAQAYRPVADLEAAGLDALVVTGAEPRAEDITQEAFWPALARLIDWAEAEGLPSLWSCLAAHAAVRRLDGIKRRPLSAKCSGVFACSAAAAGHAFLEGRPSAIATPHSRGSFLDEGELRAGGYTVLARSESAGVDSFTRGAGAMLFLQGHPEYEPNSIPLEFRRDLLRYLRRERDRLPDMPHGVFAAETETRLAALLRAAAKDRREALIELWPAASELALAPADWRAPAALMIRHWLEAGCAAERHPQRVLAWNHTAAVA